MTQQLNISIIDGDNVLAAMVRRYLEVKLSATVYCYSNEQDWFADRNRRNDVIITGYQFIRDGYTVQGLSSYFWIKLKNPWQKIVLVAQQLELSRIRNLVRDDKTIIVARDAALLNSLCESISYRFAN